MLIKINTYILCYFLLLCLRLYTRFTAFKVFILLVYTKIIIEIVDNYHNKTLFREGTLVWYYMKACKAKWYNYNILWEEIMSFCLTDLHIKKGFEINL